MEEDREDLTSELIVNGPLYTKADCIDHDCVGIFIYENNKILMLYHNKLRMWAIPVGKVKPGQNINDALIEESKEELGIDVIAYDEIITTYRPYIINGINVRVDYHIFKINKYSGEIKNMEPNKHRELKFMSPEDIKKIEPRSTASKLIIRYLEGIRY